MNELNTSNRETIAFRDHKEHARSVAANVAQALAAKDIVELRKEGNEISRDDILRMKHNTTAFSDRFSNVAKEDQRLFHHDDAAQFEAAAALLQYFIETSYTPNSDQNLEEVAHFIDENLPQGDPDTKIVNTLVTVYDMYVEGWRKEDRQQSS